MSWCTKSSKDQSSTTRTKEIAVDWCRSRQKIPCAAGWDGGDVEEEEPLWKLMGGWLLAVAPRLSSSLPLSLCQWQWEPRGVFQAASSSFSSSSSSSSSLLWNQYSWWCCKRSLSALDHVCACMHELVVKKIVGLWFRHREQCSSFPVFHDFCWGRTPGHPCKVSCLVRSCIYFLIYTGYWIQWIWTLPVLSFKN